MLEFMDFINHELKFGKEKMALYVKMIEFFVIHSARHFSSIKKLTKVNMPSTFAGFGKARNVKQFVLEMENLYDVSKLRKSPRSWQNS